MIRLTVFLAFLILATSCDKEPIEPANPIVPEEVSAIAQISQELGWQLFNQAQTSKPGENVLISPISIQTAVQMLLNGASGSTLDEFLTLMNCSGCSVDDLNALHKDLHLLLTEQSGHPSVSLVNRLFYDKNRVTINSLFKQKVQDYYSCGAEKLNFNETSTALATINGWVKEQTKGKIEKILERIDSEDVAFLINALHFRADWMTGFPEEQTHANSFTCADSSEVQVPFVWNDLYLSYIIDQDYILVDVPFRDSTYSLSFIMQGEENATANWHSQLTRETWLALYDKVQYKRLYIYFPKLKLEYENDLVSSFKTLGVQSVFNPAAADLKKFGTAPNNIFVNQIRHKAVLEVDEKGAEGAAVTSIGFSTTSVDPAAPVVRFNKPFVLVLRHISTNTIVFQGYVADPS